MPYASVGHEWLQWGAQYAVDVRDGNVVACKLVKLAVERWFDDLENAHSRGFYFDEGSAVRYFNFVAKYCRHSEGEWAGQAITFEPWQCFVEANIHGWLKIEDGTRRFRRVYEEVARKNGKTLRIAAGGLYYLTADNEPGAQVYSAATKRDQAREIFDGAREMVNQDSTLSARLIAETHKIKGRSGRSKFLPLSKDSKRMDGFNVHAGLMDELHAHQDGGIYNVVRSGTGARRQPIMRAITTAGFDRKCFCYEQRKYAIKVLEGVIDDDALFCIIYTLDDPENWEDESEWAKANPNLGVSVKIEQLREQAREAKEIPDQKVEFLTKRLNVWTYGVCAWMRMEKWNDCAVEYDSLSPWEESGDLGLFDGLECYGGLDIASVEDLCSFVLVFRWGEDERNWRVLHRSYLPEAALERRLTDGDPTLEKFKSSGHLIVLPGEVVDQDFIERDIRRACEVFDVRAIAFDRWNSSQLTQRLIADEIPMVQFGQGFASMSAPTKELMRQVLAKEVQHCDPLLTWAVSNVVVKLDPAANIKPDKSQVSEKIDPAVALIMATAMATMDDLDNMSSIYNETEL
ncbi:terminase large subunit [Teredinibacter turnerae]|uniref:terminase large subunit n=1 Tax=Teredinibacter turnerae TaxID=2426 RepID=UPI0030D37A0B